MRSLRRFVALCAALALLLVGGCALSKQRGGGAFRFPLSAEPIQLDPQMAKDAASVEVLHAVMEGLTRLDEDLTPTAAIALSWKSSDDKREWVFTLRKDALWEDGTAVTADDFAFAWERAVDPATASPVADRFANVLAAVATDEYTFSVTLRDPDPAFDRAVADTPFFPCNRAFFEQSAGRYGMDEDHVPSNGAFAVAAWEHHAYLIIHKNDGFYAKTDVLPDAVRYVIGAPDDPLTALENEALHAVEIAQTDKAAFEKKGYAVSAIGDSIYGVWMNTSVQALADAAVRLALRDTIEWSFFEDGPLGFVPKDASFDGVSFREAADAVQTPYTPTETADTLKAAKLPKLTLLCEDDPAEIETAQRILQSWQKNADLYFSLRPLPKEELNARLAVGNFELALAGVICSSDDARETLLSYVTENPRNIPRLQDAALAAAISKADTTEKLIACEKQLTKLLPVITLAYQTRYFARSVSVPIRGFNGAPYGYVYDLRNATESDQ